MNRLKPLRLQSGRSRGFRWRNRSGGRRFRSRSRGNRSGGRRAGRRSRRSLGRRSGRRSCSRRLWILRIFFSRGEFFPECVRFCIVDNYRSPHFDGRIECSGIVQMHIDTAVGAICKVGGSAPVRTAGIVIVETNPYAGNEGHPVSTFGGVNWFAGS